MSLNPDRLGENSNDVGAWDGARARESLGAWECDLETGKLSWTRGVYALFDLPCGAEVRRDEIVDMYHEASRLEMETLRANLVRCGAAFTLDAEIWTAGGQSRWMRLNARRRNGNGNGMSPIRRVRRARPSTTSLTRFVRNIAWRR